MRFSPYAAALGLCVVASTVTSWSSIDILAAQNDVAAQAPSAPAPSSVPAKPSPPAAQPGSSTPPAVQPASPTPAAPAPTPTVPPAAVPAPSVTPTNPAARLAATISRFVTRILAGGAINELLIENVQPVDLVRLPEVTVTWVADGQTWSGAVCHKPEVYTARALSKAVDQDESKTRVAVRIPPAPCVLPIYQDAEIIITRGTPAQTGETPVLFEGTVPVSVWWFPLVMTLAALGIVYPGCAMVAFYVSRRRYRRARADGVAAQPPSFWASLDPVQITRNAYGRGSVSKLQIFGFSCVVFGLLLYYQFRNGILSGLSEDVLLLLGISAIGTVGGRITYAAKRRLSLDNWVWLRRKGWLPESAEGAVTRAKWRELIVDPDSNEFDPYSFQMLIFSVVVAVALISSSLTGLSTFEIPKELLGLLGLSQAVFIGGKAAEKSGYAEFDERLRSVRAHERKHQEAHAAAAAVADPLLKPAAEAAAKAEHDAFKTEVAQAADMFKALYRDMLPAREPLALTNCDQLEPETFA